MDISEIKDRDTLEAWLQGRSREDAVAIAARAALRVLPIYWNWSLSERAREIGLTALPVLRSALTTWSAAVSPALRMKKIAADATAYTYDAGDHADHAAHSANIAVFIAAEVADVADAVHVTTNAAYAVAYAVADATNAVARAATYSAVDAAVWRSVLADCDGLKKGEDIFTFPLWRDEDPVERVWRDVAQALALPENTPEAWQFWRDWYAAMLDPIANPPNWKLYEQVALIENDVWEEGPEAIAKRIAEIQLLRAEQKLSTAEHFYYDAERDIFPRAQKSPERPNQLTYCINRLSTLLDYTDQAGNLQGILQTELFFIRRSVEKDTANPVMVWDNSKNALRVLLANIASKACPDEREEPFVGVVDTTLTEVVATLSHEPEVTELAPHRPEVPALPAPEEVEALSEGVQEIGRYLEPEVQEDMLEDQARLANPFEAPEIRRASFVRTAGRVISVWIAARYRNFHWVLDEASSISEKLAKISENIGKIGKGVGIAATTGGGAVGAILYSDKIAELIRYLVQFFS